MHELSVVFHIIKQVEEVAKENNVNTVNSVTIEIGEVSTVVPDYLLDCWNWASAKSEILKGAPLIVETLEAVSICEDCKQEYGTIAYGKTCPHCGSSHTYLLRGNEFNIKEIEVPE